VPLFDRLRKKLNYLDDAQIEQIHQTYLFANEAHHGQKRDSGEEYITHPIAVATILADLHMDHQSIMASMLHDVIEDTNSTKEFIANKFGQAVAELVDGVTKLTQIDFSTKAEEQAESFRKMVLAMSRDIRVIIIKLADRLHNMRTLDGVSPHKRGRISKETLEIYAPIANRLGMHTVCTELESLAFSYLYPRRYRVLKAAIDKIRGNRKEIMQTIEKELQQNLDKLGLKNTSIVGREKNLYSIYRKMRTRHASFEEIMDVYAFRIINEKIDDCYRVLGMVHSIYKPVPGKFKDYIAIPKYNGYQSLHTTLRGPYSIPIEIQIRTQTMDQMANNGIAAHWLYKSDDKNSIKDAAHIRAQQWVKNLLEMQQNTGSPLEFIENVRIDLFPDEVYVFTPKGNIMELPRGSTAVDFAYAIHTDIGNSCVASRIDRQFAPLSTVLVNGQNISIITAPDAKPNPIWLNFVVTGKARSGIRNFLKNQKQSEAIELGKQLLGKALADLSIAFYQIPSQAIQKVLNETKLKNLDELYENIGLGNRLAVFIAHQIINEMQTTISTESKSEITKSPAKEKPEAKPLLIKGAEGVAITFAPCCYPIPGDNIVGYFNVGQGIEVHTEDCANLIKLRKQPEKCIPVRWADDITEEFKVAVNVEMVHQRGALAQVAKAISDAGSSIDDISMSDKGGGYCIVSLVLMVRNTAHLERILRHISSAPVVIGVIRKR
jgi:GTP diphosphokinase / guanosine-3',5'-bis(diphosphate) 3'-diphosphatase